MRSDRDTVIQYFQSADRRPNRALGQNFCVDGDALDAVAAALPLGGRPVVEIGAGLGALTERLLRSPASRVYAIELDAALAAETGTALLCDRLAMVMGDVLELDMSIFPPGAVWCGNLPYYITTPITERLLALAPPAMALMVQREAADRFFAAPSDKNYGAVAVISQLYYDLDVLFSLDPTSYYPPPDVRSAVVRLVKKPDAPDVPPARLAAFVKGCLAMRRKTLQNNLSAFPGAADAIAACGLPAGVRAEALPPQTLLRLYKTLADAPLSPKI